MAPKRRSKVVGSAVKTKVVQETVQITTAIVADDDEPDQQAEAAAAALAVEELSPGVNVSGSGGSTVVRVEVTTPDGDTASADVNVKQPGRKRGRGGSTAAAAAQGGGDDQEENTPPPPPQAEEEAPVSLQSQETQDPNEHEAEAEDDDEDASKTKKKMRHEANEEEEAPETPKVASERKSKTKAADEQGAAAGTTTRRRPRRRRLGAVTAGGDAATGGMGGYRRYVWRVLKQVHPDLGVSGRAMQVLDMMMADIFERLAGEAARLTKIGGKMTLTSREVQTAVRLVLPGELGKHAISEGVKAISKYMAA